MRRSRHSKTVEFCGNVQITQANACICVVWAGAEPMLPFCRRVDSARRRGAVARRSSCANCLENKGVSASQEQRENIGCRQKRCHRPEARSSRSHVHVSAACAQHNALVGHNATEYGSASPCRCAGYNLLQSGR